MALLLRILRGIAELIMLMALVLILAFAMVGLSAAIVRRDWELGLLWAFSTAILSRWTVLYAEIQWNDLHIWWLRRVNERLRNDIDRGAK